MSTGPAIWPRASPSSKRHRFYDRIGFAFMWTNVVIHRALACLMFVGALIIALHKSIPELKTPLASSLLAVTVLLLLLRPIIRETQLSSHFRTRVLLIGNGPLAKKF